jgi:hypothetical protein
MLLVNSSFVGGLGAARKAASFVYFLKKKQIPYCIFTDSNSVAKLKLVGLNPDLIVTNDTGSSPEYLYQTVNNALKHVAYDAMVSFGWRTYVPFDAVMRSKPVIIIDGGFPERFEDWPSPFCLDVYSKLTAYCLTNYFFSSKLENILPTEKQIPFTWIAQPFDEKEISWHIELIQNKISLQEKLPYHETSYRHILLDMNPDYVSAKQGTYTGGWLSPRQIDECRGFVSRLIVELDQSNEKISLIINENIVDEFQTLVNSCNKVKIIAQPSLEAKEHHLWRLGSNLVLHRAVRCVGTTQTALSRIPNLKIVCPSSEDYMGELSSCQIAQTLGVADAIDHQNTSLAKGILDYMESKQLDITTDISYDAAFSFWKWRGPEYILSLIGLD